MKRRNFLKALPAAALTLAGCGQNKTAPANTASLVFDLNPEQEDVMRTEIKLMLLLVILGALLGCFGEHAAGFACVGAALAVWVGGNLGLAWMQFRLSRQIVAAAAEMHIAVECGLRTPLYEAMISGLSDYRKLYADIRGQVAGGVEYLQPLLNARYDLFYKLTVQKHRFRI